MLAVSKMEITKWKNERSFHKFPYFFLTESLTWNFIKVITLPRFLSTSRTYRLTFPTLIHITTVILRVTFFVKDFSLESLRTTFGKCLKSTNRSNLCF